MRFTRPLSFVRAEGQPTAELTTESIALLDELADAVLARPAGASIRIEARWDRALPPDEARAMTELQARSVAVHLAGAGIDRDRIEAAGLGTPEVDTDAPGRSRRRVDIVLLDSPVAGP